MTSPAIRVAILEDDEMMREGLASLLSLYGLQVTFTARDIRSFWEAVSGRVPDVALIDLFLESEAGAPPQDGCEVIQRLRLEHPEVRAIVLSGSKEHGIVERCRRAGAVAFLDKLSAGAEAVVATVRAVAASRLAQP